MMNEKGSFAITALWVLAILSLLAMTFARDTLLAFRYENYALRASEAVWLAKSGVYQALAVLQADVPADSLHEFDALNESWADSPDLFKDVALGHGRFEVSYQDVEGGRGVYGVVDENRKINLNSAPLAVLRRLPGMSEDKVAALLDWIDADSRPRAGGAEYDYYASLDPPQICRNAPLAGLDELLMVRGFSRQDLNNWRGLVTIYGDGSVNINTAPAAVLQILGMPPALADKIVAARPGADGIAHTQDDLVIERQPEISRVLNERLKLSLDEQIVLNRLTAEQALGVKSTHFRIDAYGRTLNGQIRRRITAIVQRSGSNHLRIVGWHEDEL